MPTEAPTPRRRHPEDPGKGRVGHARSAKRRRPQHLRRVEARQHGQHAGHHGKTDQAIHHRELSIIAPEGSDPVPLPSVNHRLLPTA